MPLSLPRLKITIEEFDAMPHLIGWKHEYWDGMARLSPSHTAVAHLRLNLQRPSSQQERPTLGSQFLLRNVLPSDAADLIELHCRAFDESVEYAGYGADDYLRCVTDSIQGFYGAPNRSGYSAGELAGSSAVEANGKLVAALLLRQDRNDGWVIAPVMVDEGYQRQGLAQAMLRQTVDWLREHAVDELNSRCQLSNSKSLAWHAAVGFHEQPTSFAAGHRANHHRWMCRHHEAAGREAEAQHHAELAEVYWQLSVVCQELEHIAFAAKKK